MNRLERGIVDGMKAAGSATATGPRIYNLFPLLVGRVSAWRRELPRIAGLGFDWVYLNPFHEAGFSGSLYAIKDPYKLDPRFRDKGALKVTMSVGVAAFPDDARDRATLIERADLALYHAKHTGRNRVVTWGEAQAAKSKKAS